MSSLTFVDRRGADDGHPGAAVGLPRLYEISRSSPQFRFLGLDALGGAGWLKALKPVGYAPRRPSLRLALQRALLPYLEAL